MGRCRRFAWARTRRRRRPRHAWPVNVRTWTGYSAGAQRIASWRQRPARGRLRARPMTADTRWTRRDFLSTTALGMVGLGLSGSSAGADERFAYIGTYTNTAHSDGIYRLF